LHKYLSIKNHFELLTENSLNPENRPGEFTILLESIHPGDLFGLKEEKLKLLKKLFPKLRIILRGNELKLMGDDDEINLFDEKFKHILAHFEKYNKVTDEVILEIIASDYSQGTSTTFDSDNQPMLLHGRNGMIIKARTPNQVRMVDSFKTHDMIFAIGPAGTGKTTPPLRWQ
jgi:phosphate starvation-inducible protein PhoH and related proteins